MLRVISLARTPGRLVAFRAANPHIPAELLPAIDGREVGYVDFLPPHLPWTQGAVGCLLSHLTFWDQVAASGDPMTVFEDDAVVHHRFSELAEAVVAGLPTDWHIIHWGANADAAVMLDAIPGVTPAVVQINQDLLRAALPAFQSSDIRPQALGLIRFHGTVSYSISPAGVAALRALCLPIPDVTIAYPGLPAPLENNGLDRTLNAVYQRVRAFMCFPPLVVTPNLHEESTVLLRAEEAVGE